MTKLGNSTFAAAVSPALKDVGRVTGRALGRVVKGGEDLLLAGLNALADGAENVGMTKLAQASRVQIQSIEATGKMPFATSDLEAEDGAKAKPAKKAGLAREVAREFGEGYKEGRRAPPQAKKTPGPAPQMS